MRRGRLHRVLSLALVASLTLAMSNYDDPRVLLSYKDGGLAGGRDILRVTAAANEEGQLVFEVMTRAPGRETGPDDYVSLQISQRITRQFLLQYRGSALWMPSSTYVPKTLHCRVLWHPRRRSSSAGTAR